MSTTGADRLIGAAAPPAARERFDGADRPSFPSASLAEAESTLRALMAGGLLPRDARGRLLAPRLRGVERAAIKMAAGRPYRTGRRLRGELLALQFVAARAVQPQLGVVEFLESLATAH